MSATLSDSNPDASAPEQEAAPQSESLELTPREIAIAEGNDPDEVGQPAETDATTETAVAETKPAEVAAAQPPKPWFEDYDRTVASTFGLSDDDLKDFSSREEFGRVIKHLAKVRQSQPKAEPQKQEPAKTEAVVEDADQPEVNGKINPAYYEKRADEYDADTIRIIKQQRALQDKLEAIEQQGEQRSKQLEEQQAAAEYQRQMDAFHDACDAVDPELFGKSLDEFGNPVDLTDDAAANRKSALEEVYWLSQRIIAEQQAKGLPPAVPSFPQLLKQAIPRAFADQLAKREAEKKKQAAISQSREIRPAAGSNGAAAARRAPVTQSDDPDEIANDPEIVAFWNKRNSR